MTGYVLLNQYTQVFRLFLNITVYIMFPLEIG